MQEIYKDVIGFEEYFKISNLGNLYSKRSKRLLKQTILPTGYYSASTKIGGRNGKSVCFRIHRLVAEAFLDNPTEDQLEFARTSIYGKVLVNHIDGNKLNNNVNNLEWRTAKENTYHAVQTGLIKSYLTNTDYTEHGSVARYRGSKYRDPCRCDLCKEAYSVTRKDKYLRLGT